MIRSFRHTLRAASVSAAALLLAVPLAAQIPARPAASKTGTAASEVPPYADLADLALASPVIADATVRSATRLKGADAAGVAPGRQRFYIEADIAALIRAPGALPTRIGYLLDAPLDARGRAPRLKKQRVILFARPVPTAAGQVQLTAPDAQLPWTAALDAAVRGVAREVAAADAPPAITGIGNAFHVPGALPGEGETQLFLQTEDRRPVSLSILRRPGEERRWAVSLSEIVDESARPPAQGTLLWYRLACGLPPELPAAATDQLGAEDAARAREDYRFVFAQLGPCVRQRGTS